MKNLLCLAVLSVVTAIPYLRASAQQEQSKATIPFSFHVGDATLPAGSYTIVSNGGTRFISITGVDLKTHAGTLAMNDWYGTGRPNLVVFNKYGNQYFLHRIVRSNPRNAWFLVPTKAEKQVRRGTERAGLALEDHVVVAMNDTAPTLSGVDSTQ